MADQEKNAFAVSKPGFDSINETIETTLGDIQVRGPLEPSSLNTLKLSEGLNFFRPARRQHLALVELAGQDDGLVFVASIAHKIVSYVSFQKPDYPWWQDRCLPEVIELGGLETDLSWRKMGITTTLLDYIFNNPKFTYFEDFIVIAVQFVQSWDLNNTGLAPWAYREFMLKLFGKYGFTTWETIDPEVREHPCNLLLARIGEKIDRSCITAFSYSCLGTQLP